ncbi:MAG: alpha/beta fold hydrolase, partial [Chlamydiae bacterium]|nr:alpha/beta fold hydrolase [Chlamydiota bacterium]
MENFIDFDPLVKSSFIQTVFGSSFGIDPYFPSKTHLVTLPDQDKIALEISCPKSWQDGQPIVLMLHGMCGSHKSLYLKRTGKRLYQKGFQVIRMNFRGCGSGLGLAKNIYHCGCSPDVDVVMRHIKLLFPKSKIILIGVSMGGNVALKLGGELKEEAQDFLHSIIAISPPVNLLSSVRLFLKPHNRFYANYFMKILLNNVDYLHNKFQDLTPPKFPQNLSLVDFDEIYVAPRAKFHSAQEYYQMSSAQRVIKEIKVPAKILFAEDDPLISPTSLDKMILPENVQVFKTKFGGHLGYMGKNIFSEFRWMDNLLIRWIDEVSERSGSLLDVPIYSNRTIDEGN